MTTPTTIGERFSTETKKLGERFCAETKNATAARYANLLMAFRQLVVTKFESLTKEQVLQSQFELRENDLKALKISEFSISKTDFEATDLYKILSEWAASEKLTFKFAKLCNCGYNDDGPCYCDIPKITIGWT